MLLISISTEEIVSSIDILEQKGLTILVIIGALVLVFGYLLAGILMKPFAKVTRAIEDITDGFQDEKISVPDYTETELITDAFNKMLGRVQSLDTSRQEFVSNVSHELKNTADFDEGTGGFAGRTGKCTGGTVSGIHAGYRSGD